MIDSDKSIFNLINYLTIVYSLEESRDIIVTPLNHIPYQLDPIPYQ